MQNRMVVSDNKNTGPLGSRYNCTAAPYIIMIQSPSSRISFWMSRPAARASWSMPRMRAMFLP